ncbi:Acyl-homoserine-lactone acylase [Saliniradius amylolyticus]|uniref:Acyl-homoserine-lactone acylase n=1 Tax=Saliniradius amylolyticus TaxID=2183582 RepID=A0A2S2E656_9ALTE|nr:penicillin acylase family protein [Saliniradius amylolyticus]AWL13131.1 Acyl-homoserine-lactone acylase [Saliniradius amylolyticus]
MEYRNPVFRLSLMAAAIVGLSACFDSDSKLAVEVPEPPATEQPESLPPQPELATFAPEGQALTAQINWTDYGVPYVKADNLESLGFGVGYAFANDNICILADQIVRFNSKRSLYFGPHTPGTTDNANLVNDFGYLALGIRDNAEQHFEDLSDEAKALLNGYAEGYNEYLARTGSANIDPGCAGQPWVQPITPMDLLTFSQGVALLPGAANFVQTMFIAAPPGQSFEPMPVAGAVAEPVKTNISVRGIPDPNPTEAGSNGWAIGKDKSASGKGMLLANPHFPHTGNQRFWQFGIEVPGSLKVVGGSLSGMPGIVNIGFNENVGWTHTFSTAEHFVLHRLKLNPDDTAGTSYMVDGEPVAMTTKTHQIQVATGPGSFVTLEKTSYHTQFGPVIVVPGQLPWGTDFTGDAVAYTINDANLPNFDIFDHWLGLNRARNMDEYKAVFEQETGIVFNNAMAVDKDGNAFYTDGSSVPNLSPDAVEAWQNDLFHQRLSDAAGLPIVPGDSALFMTDGKIPFERAPQLERTDFVQNSNNSYWLSNPAAPLELSPLFGPTGVEQSYRSRMGQKLLAEKETLAKDDLVAALTDNRNFLGEELLEPLLAACTAQGVQPVLVGDELVSIKPACDALVLWDGTMNKASAGGMMFREFAIEFGKDPQWQVAFNPADPTNTPRELDANSIVMRQLAVAQQRIVEAGLDPAATLADVQFVERSLPDGSPSGNRLPWGAP